MPSNFRAALGRDAKKNSIAALQSPQQDTGGTTLFRTKSQMPMKQVSMTKILSRFRAFAAGALLCCLIATSGCISNGMTPKRIAPAPPLEKPQAVVVSGGLPIDRAGVPDTFYQVPGSRVLVHGPKERMFRGGGLVRAMETQEILNSTKKTIQSASSNLVVDVIAPAMEALSASSLAPEFQGHFYTPDNQGSGNITIAPYLVFDYIDLAKVDTYLIIDVAMPSRSGSKANEWGTRFICQLGYPRELNGPSGWMFQDALVVRSALRAAMEKTMPIILRELLRPGNRRDDRLMVVEARLPFVDRKWQSLGYLLGESDEFVVFLPRIGDAMVFSGVNILDRANISLRPAQERDRKRGSRPLL
jgi:hypothetical protein